MRAECPECGKTLQVRDDLPKGKRIKCPGCASVFAPVQDAKDDGRFESDEKPTRGKRGQQRDDDERDDESNDRPSRGKRGRQNDDDERDDDVDVRRRKKRRKSRQGSSAGLIWGLVGGGVLLIAGAIVVVVILAAGGSSARGQHEEAIKEAIQAMTDLENAMKEIKDPNSARTSAVKIHQICDRLEALANKVRALPKISPADHKHLQDKYKPQADGFNQRMQQIGFQAGMNSRGEPAFLAAAQRLARVGQTLQQLGI